MATELVDGGVTDLTVDLSRVTWIGRSGLAALVNIAELLDTGRRQLVLVGATDTSEALFRIDRLNRAYHILPAHLGTRTFCRFGSGRTPPGERPPVVPLTGHLNQVS